MPGVTETATDGYLRIGGGPPKQQRKGSKTTGIVVASLVLAAAAVAVILLNGAKNTGGQAASSPAPSLARLSKQETCVLLIPTMTAAAKQVTAIVTQPDGTTVDWERVNTLIRDLQMLRDTGAPELTPDIDQHIPALRQMHDLHLGLEVSTLLNLDGFRSSGLRLAGQCSSYATS